MVASAAIFLGLSCYAAVEVDSRSGSEDNSQKTSFNSQTTTTPINFLQATNVVTVSQYTQFLNAVAVTDPHHLYDPAMGGDPSVGNILRFGEAGSYSYGFVETQANDPVFYVGTEAGMRFCNWESNGGTETGAYNISSSGEIVANPGSAYLLTSEEEINFTALHCNKVDLVVVFNSAALGQMFEEPVLEAAGEILGGGEVGTVVTAV